MDWLTTGLLLAAIYLAAYLVGYWVMDFILRDYW
jgi:hypothetical protein